MTEDYKETLLKYLTGNLNKDTGTNVPIFTQQEETLNNNVYENIYSILTTEQGATFLNILGKIYSETYGQYLIYGYYQDSSSNNYGFIYLVDDELNEVQMITEFASGTKMFPLISLNQAEDGNIYGLSHTIGTTPGTTKVMLFNNIFSSGLITGEYKAVLRNDYTIPYSYYPTYYRQNCITKSPDTATYYIILQDGSGNTHIVKFIINVGSTNTWEQYQITDNTFFYRYATKLDKSSGNEIFYFYALSYYTTSYLEYSLNGSTLTKDKEISITNIGISPSSSQVYAFGNNIYVSVADNLTKYTTLYIVDGNQLVEITKTQWNGSYYVSYETFALNDGLFYLKICGKQDGKDIYIGYIEQITNNIYEEYIISSGQHIVYTTIYDYVDYYYTGLYNLINVYIPVYGTPNTTTRLTFDFNILNYNGLPYENVDALYPRKGRLYDDNNMMVFARNLYNKTVYGNTTLSQLQLPNTLLNNTTISMQSLISQTDLVLNENQETITKNIYETVYFNFYNTLLIQNRNNPTYVNNIPASEVLNNSISTTTAYDNDKATKYRIIYNDNSTSVNSIIPTITNDIATYDMNIVSTYNNPAKTVEIISEDENTIYQTIDVSNLTPGKIYNITQDCYIE